jgi:hypothetical protein
VWNEDQTNCSIPHRFWSARKVVLKTTIAQDLKMPDLSDEELDSLTLADERVKRYPFFLDTGKWMGRPARLSANS